MEKMTAEDRDPTMGKINRPLVVDYEADAFSSGDRSDAKGDFFPDKRSDVDRDLGEMTSEAIISAALEAAPRYPLLRHPFIRKIYLIIYVLSALLFLLPYWTIKYSIRANRPRQSWTLQRCLRVRWSRLLCGLVARCEIDYLGRDLQLDLEPSTLTHSHPVVIPAAPASYLVGHPAEMLAELHRTRGGWIPRMIHRVDPTAAGTWGKWNDVGDKEKTYGFEPVKAFWYTGKKERPDAVLRDRPLGTPVGIHFHGGGYICGTAAETDLTSSIAKALVVHSPLHHILAVDYRLAPTSPWPLPLLDAISAYVWLVRHQNVQERDIILIGDSAGGHLSLALARFIRDNGRSLGLHGPRGLVLLSPWVDIGFTSAWGEGKYHNANSDLIDDTFGPFATSLLLRALQPKLMHTSTYLSPASLLIPPSGDMFADFPPMFVVHGTAERISTSIEVFWDRLQLARGDSSSSRTGFIPDKHLKGVDCVHDFMIFPWQSEEAGQVYAIMDEWLRELLSADDPEGEAEGEGSESGLESDETRVEGDMALTTEKERERLAALPSPSLSPIALGPSAAAWSPLFLPNTAPAEASASLTKRQRIERRLSRQSLKVGKSPRLAPVRPGVVGMMGDMRQEAMSYMSPSVGGGGSNLIPMPSLDLMSPLLGQVEKGEWDWDGGAELMGDEEEIEVEKEEEDPER